jgi:hypothetical protein
MQAIVVKYLGPTNRHGSRYKATAEGGSVIVPCDSSLSDDENHLHACEALAHKMKWTPEYGRRFEGKWIEGGLPNGLTVFVFRPWAF